MMTQGVGVNIINVTPAQVQDVGDILPVRLILQKKKPVIRLENQYRIHETE